MAHGTTLARTVNEMLRRGAGFPPQRLGRSVVVPVPGSTITYHSVMSDAPPPGWGGPPPPPQGPPGGPYPAPGQPPAGYPPYNPYGGGGNFREHPQGTTILVLGILSLVICSILGPFAWSMGQKALREIDSDPTTTYTNRGAINAGRICGIIATCLLGLAVIVIIIATIAAAGSN
ncbi:MAG: hypothetical protein JWM12_3422 [Ilumatobacteraceae bacterium]|nr:hypothetical protein [Ilumatobacteraceae bacterium]